MTDVPSLPGGWEHRPPRDSKVSQGQNLKPCGCTLIPPLLLRFTGSHKGAVSWDFWENQLRHKHTHEPH